MSSPPGGWLLPRCETRTGAAHHRRGAPCQDASGTWSFVDVGRQPIQILVVSDGHGGSRYDRSDVGSHVACTVAMQTIHEHCQSHGALSATPDDWNRWLAQDLPSRIVERWRQEVLTHAQDHPRGGDSEASTIAYGATLGLLLLTRRWWGFTGLGDWDLVRLDASGEGELLSEEPDNPGGGEATFSLCMEGAARFFASRSGRVDIVAGQSPFSLLLSTDGIRKSCANDGDYITLARYLSEQTLAGAAGSDPGLAEALDHISSQGSGDDVSVAIARWDPLQAVPERLSRRRVTSPLIVQPRLPQQNEVAMTLAPSGPSRPVRSGSSKRAKGTALEVTGEKTGSSQLRVAPWLLVLLAALILAGAGVGLALWFGVGPWARRAPKPDPIVSADQQQLVAQEAHRLCHLEVPVHPGIEAIGADPDPDSDSADLLQRIRSNLTPYKGIFRRLRKGETTPQDMLAHSQKDPRGSLIAWSALQPGLGPLAPQKKQATSGEIPVLSGLPTWMPGPSQPAASDPQIAICPELRHALQEQWRGGSSDHPTVEGSAVGSWASRRGR